MMVFEDLKSMNIDEFAEWFERNCLHDDDPCIRWWNDTYCRQCEAIVKNGQEYGYCELHGRCRYLQNMPSTKHIIKLWLESDTEDSKCLPMPDDYCFEMGV